MLTEAQARSILGRYAPVDEVDTLLAEATVTRTVGGVVVTLYDPYAAALAWLMRPDTVKSYRIGDVQEEYLDPSKVLAWLEGQSAALRLTWPLADGAAAAYDLGLNIVGWGL